MDTPNNSRRRGEPPAADIVDTVVSVSDGRPIVTESPDDWREAIAAAAGAAGSPIEDPELWLLDGHGGAVAWFHSRPATVVLVADSAAAAEAAIEQVPYEHDSDTSASMAQRALSARRAAEI